MSLLYPFTTMSFEDPWLLLVPAVIFFLLIAEQSTKRAVVVPSASLYAGLPRSFRQRLRTPVLALLLACSVMGWSIAAARPQRVSVEERVQEGRNIVLAIDVSPSMGARDFSAVLGSVTRLRAVQGVVTKFVEERKGDRIGLVVFGGEAFLQSPLTPDLTMIQALVERLHVGMAGDGTAIGDGLGVALKRVRALPAESATVILLTDGVSNVGQVNPLKAAKVARDLGIKVHTIGIGSEQAITVMQPGNIFSSIMRQQAEFDEETLKEIARLTGGTYFSASDVEALEGVYEKIDALERTRETDEGAVLVEELFVPYAIFGSVSYLLYLALALSVFMRVPE